MYGKSIQVASTLLSRCLSPDFNFPRGKSISEVHFLRRLIWRDTFRFVSRPKREHFKWDTDFCNIRGYAQQQQPPNVCWVWIEKKNSMNMKIFWTIVIVIVREFDLDTKVFIISIASETSLDGFLEICVIMREFSKKNFFRNADFCSYGDYTEKNSAFWKKKFLKIALKS